MPFFRSSCSVIPFKIRNFAAMESVVLQNLSIGYLTKDSRKVVATGLNATINSGELTCLLGRNGIGKSTLLRTLSAFQPALDGDINIALNSHPSSLIPHPSDITSHPSPLTSHPSSIIHHPSSPLTSHPSSIIHHPSSPLTSLSDKERSRVIGIVLTEKPDVQNMTIEELVGMGRSPYTGFWGTLDAEDEEIVREAIRLVGIENLRGRMVHTLSDGERQKVMIAKALAQQTPIIYLDEPTAFLDFPSKVETMQLLRRLAIEEQKTIFLSTHDVELSLQLADKIWLMEPEQLSVGTPAELAAQGVLSRFIEHDGIVFDKDSLTIHIRK
jgi:iron complex transport system ATP-binding protein